MPNKFCVKGQPEIISTQTTIMLRCMSNLGLKFKDSSTASKKMLVEYYEITLNRYMCYDNIICPNLTHNKVGAYCHHLTKNIDPR